MDDLENILKNGFLKEHSISEDSKKLIEEYKPSYQFISDMISFFLIDTELMDIALVDRIKTSAELILYSGKEFRHVLYAGENLSKTGVKLYKKFKELIAEEKVEEIGDITKIVEDHYTDIEDLEKIKGFENLLNNLSHEYSKNKDYSTAAQIIKNIPEEEIKLHIMAFDALLDYELLDSKIEDFKKIYKRILEFPEEKDKQIKNIKTNDVQVQRASIAYAKCIRKEDYDGAILICDFMGKLFSKNRLPNVLNKRLEQVIKEDDINTMSELITLYGKNSKFPSEELIKRKPKKESEEESKKPEISLSKYSKELIESGEYENLVLLYNAFHKGLTKEERIIINKRVVKPFNNAIANLLKAEEYESIAKLSNTKIKIDKDKHLELAETTKKLFEKEDYKNAVALIENLPLKKARKDNILNGVFLSESKKIVEETEYELKIENIKRVIDLYVKLKPELSKETKEGIDEILRTISSREYTITRKLKEKSEDYELWRTDKHQKNRYIMNRLLLKMSKTLECSYIRGIFTNIVDFCLEERKYTLNIKNLYKYNKDIFASNNKTKEEREQDSRIFRDKFWDIKKQRRHLRKTEDFKNINDVCVYLEEHKKEFNAEDLSFMKRFMDYLSDIGSYISNIRGQISNYISEMRKRK